MANIDYDEYVLDVMQKFLEKKIDGKYANYLVTKYIYNNYDKEDIYKLDIRKDIRNYFPFFLFIHESSIEEGQNLTRFFKLMKEKKVRIRCKSYGSNLLGLPIVKKEGEYAKPDVWGAVNEGRFIPWEIKSCPYFDYKCHTFKKSNLIRYNKERNTCILVCTVEEDRELYFFYSNYMIKHMLKYIKPEIYPKFAPGKPAMRIDRKQIDDFIKKGQISIIDKNTTEFKGIFKNLIDYIPKH